MPNYESIHSGSSIDGAVTSESNDLQAAISAIANVSPEFSDKVSVQNGGPKYYWYDGDTTTADGVLVIESDIVGYRPSDVNEGRWKADISSGFAPSTWWSLNGDGVADNSASLQSAIDACSDNKIELLVLAPSSSYRLASNVSINAPHGFTMRGVGNAGATDGWVTFSTDQAIKMITLGQDVVNGWRHVRVENLRFLDTGGTAVCGLELVRITHGIFVNLQFEDFTTGSGLYFNAPSPEWTQYCVFIGCGCNNTKYGIHKKAGNLSDSVFLGGYWSGNNKGDATSSPISGGKGVYEEAGTGGRNDFLGAGFNNWETAVELRGLRITRFVGCSFEQSESNVDTGTAIKLIGDPVAGNGTGTRIEDCTFVRVKNGIDIYEDSDTVVVKDPIFSSWSDPTSRIIDRGPSSKLDWLGTYKIWAITAVDTATEKFTISGNHSAVLDKRSSGTNTSLTNSRLVDSSATFLDDMVRPGDFVYNETDSKSSQVNLVSSQTELVLRNDIFSATSQSYTVGPSIFVVSSTGNNNRWTVSSATDVASNTEIIVHENVTDATVDGSVIYGERLPVQPILKLPAGTGLHVREEHSSGGLYLSANAETSAYLGAGIAGDPLSLTTLSSSPSFIRFNAGDIFFFGADGKDPGSSLTNSELLRFKITAQAEFIHHDSSGIETSKDVSGSGSPEGSTVAFTGSTYRRYDGGASTSFYVKESETGGTNTSTSEKKLIDSGATFSTDGVTTASIVVNVTDGNMAQVTGVDSETQLSIDTDIFTGTGKTYRVENNTGWVAK